jgi:hypothetical protein
MKIARSLATRLMQRALRHEDSPLLALIDDQRLIQAESPEGWLRQAADSPRAVRVYNQHPEALAIVESLPALDDERRIEIFQDTEGVFGLRAYRFDGKLARPETLAFDEQA